MALSPVPTAALSISTEKTPMESLLRCAGRVTVDNVSELRQTTKSLIAESKCVLLDFNGVTAIDSSGIGVIVGFMVSAKKSDCKLKFVNLTPRVQQIFTRNRVFEALRYLGLSD